MLTLINVLPVRETEGLERDPALAQTERVLSRASGRDSELAFEEKAKLVRSEISPGPEQVRRKRVAYVVE